MKYHTSIEVGKILGVSGIRVTQIMTYDCFETTCSGMGRRYLYSDKTIQKFLDNRDKEHKHKVRNLIKKELKGVARPDGGYLTPTEASEFSGRTKTVIANHLKPKWVGSKRFYLRTDLISMPASAKPRVRGKAGKKTVAICECGRTFMRNNAFPKCPVCMYGVDKNDPYGVIVPLKKGVRKCPICGKPLFIGQLTCGSNECKAEITEEISSIDAAYCYGSN